MRSVTIPLALFLALSALPSAARAVDVDKKAEVRAHDFLKTTTRGSFVIGYVHFGSKYDRHKYVATVGINDDKGREIPGQFALIYDYEWDGTGLTRLGFLCDPKGTIYAVQVLKTNAVLSQPYDLANATIKLLGNVLLEAFKKDLTDEQRKQVQKLVDDANSQAMMTFALKLQQDLGR